MEANIDLVSKNDIENDDYQVDEAEFDALFQYYKTRTENENHTARLYTIFCILRVVLTLAPQSGYIHPDEFMQSIEVVGGMYVSSLFLKTSTEQGKESVRNFGFPFFL